MSVDASNLTALSYVPAAIAWAGTKERERDKQMFYSTHISLRVVRISRLTMSVGTFVRIHSDLNMGVCNQLGNLHFCTR